MLGKSFSVLLTLITSFALSLAIICFLLSVLNSEKNSAGEVMSEDTISTLQDKYLACANLTTEQDRLNCQYPDLNADKKSLLSTLQCLQEFSSDSKLIVAIYFLLVFSLSLQIYIIIGNTFFRKGAGFVNRFSEWSINAPPMLGVLGTVIAFSIFVASTKGGNIAELFTSSFYDAAKTTILGGFVYVINFFINSIGFSLDKSNV